MREDSTTRRLGRPPKPPVKCICEHCGRDFERPAWRVRGDHTYCGRECRNDALGHHPRPSAVDRFWAKVDRSGGPDACWLWTGSKTGGYGQFHAAAGTFVMAHRFAWELTNGPIPAGLRACHQCDCPQCVNPAHLFLGTQADNVADCIAKGRRGVTPIKGERSWNAKLTDDAVRDIRRRCAAGEEQRAIAAEYGISESTLSQIKNGQSWKHVA